MGESISSLKCYCFASYYYRITVGLDVITWLPEHIANMFVKRLFWLKDVLVNAKIRNQINMSSLGLRLAEGSLIPNCVTYSEQQLKNIFVNIDSVAGNIVRLSDRQSE